MLCCFFFQAEDGIRDYKVTGVQTCALPILKAVGVSPPRTMSSTSRRAAPMFRTTNDWTTLWSADWSAHASDAGSTSMMGSEIGRASCRERRERAVSGREVEEEDDCRTGLER